jgi:hypothetical protein
MNKQELKTICANASAWLARCTPTGFENVARFHRSTIQLLKWVRAGLVEPCKPCISSVESLIIHIVSMRQNEAMVNPESKQLTLDWESMPL